MTRNIPCGDREFHAMEMESFGWRKCTKDDPCLNCLNEAYRIHTAENDPTPADVEWLESVGVTGWRFSTGLCYALDAGCVTLLYSDVMDRKARLCYSPTRGAILKLLAALSPQGASPMTPTFTTETHQYRNGEKPLDVHLLKGCTSLFPLRSVRPSGSTEAHTVEGFLSSSKEPSPYDLIPIPKSRPWNCAEDVIKSGAKWLKCDSMIYFIFKADKSGVCVIGDYGEPMKWPYESLNDSKPITYSTDHWSGPWLPCTVNESEVGNG